MAKPRAVDVAAGSGATEVKKVKKPKKPRPRAMKSKNKWLATYAALKHFTAQNDGRWPQYKTEIEWPIGSGTMCRLGLVPYYFLLQC